MLAFNLLIAAEKKTSGVQENAASDKKVAFTVDRFGQTTLRNFPDKIKDESELKKDAITDEAYYKSLKPLATDAWGGLPNSRKKFDLKATGFFHVEKHGDRWIMVDPAGNAFFHLGVCTVAYSDDYTLIKGRREVFEWLPPVDGEFKAAWMNPDVISFYIANCIRKYGPSFDREQHIRRLVDRLKHMGFNSIGAFTSKNPIFVEEHIPYVLHADIHAPSLPGLGFSDPFDENSLKQMDEGFARTLVPNAKDSLVIGYFFANEQNFEDIPRIIPKLPGKHAAKRKLVQMLQQKYSNIASFNNAWGQHALDFNSLADMEIPVQTQKAFDDMHEYTALFLDQYFGSIARTFHKYDKNHLMIGNRFTPWSANNEILCREAGKYLDVISINYYTNGIDKTFIKRIYDWSGQKPQILSEFFYSSEAESNVDLFNTDMKTQKERGSAYRSYVENAASLGFVVGSEWFELGDMAVTGRWFDGYDINKCNTGIFNVADRPYRDMIAGMLAGNTRIYDVWLNGSAPYQINDPRFTNQTGAGKKRGVVSAAHVVNPFKINGTADGWPALPPVRIGSDRVVDGMMGTGLEATFKVCWDEKNLFLLVLMSDSTPLNNTQSGVGLWNGDGVELYIGSEHLDQDGSLLFSDHQLLLGAGRDIKGNPWYLVNSDKQPAVEMITIPSPGGYTLEAAIPWNSLGITPKENQELLFDLAVDNANAGTGRNCQIMWNGRKNNSGDRTNWGRLRLVP
jgi:hypothetical protein